MSKIKIKTSKTECNIVDLIESGEFHNCFYIHSNTEYKLSIRYFNNPKYVFIVSNRISKYKPDDFPYNNYFLDYSIEQILYRQYWRDMDKELTYLNNILPSFKKRIDKSGNYAELLPNQLKKLFDYSEILTEIKNKRLVNIMTPALFLDRLHTKFELDNLTINKKINQAIGSDKAPFTMPINMRIFNQNYPKELNKLKNQIIEDGVLYLKIYNFSFNQKKISLTLLKNLSRFLNDIKTRIPLIIINGLGAAGLHIKAKNIIPAFRLNYPGLTLKKIKINKENNYFIPPMFFCPNLGTYFLRKMCREEFNCNRYKKCEQNPNLGKIVKMKRNIDNGVRIKTPPNLTIHGYIKKIKLRKKINTISVK